MQQNAISVASMINVQHSMVMLSKHSGLKLALWAQTFIVSESPAIILTPQPSATQVSEEQPTQKFLKLWFLRVKNLLHSKLVNTHLWSLSVWQVGNNPCHCHLWFGGCSTVVTFKVGNKHLWNLAGWHSVSSLCRQVGLTFNPRNSEWIPWNANHLVSHTKQSQTWSWTQLWKQTAA